MLLILYSIIVDEASSGVQSADAFWTTRAIFYNLWASREWEGVFGTLAAVSKITQSLLTE